MMREMKRKNNNEKTKNKKTTTPKSTNPYARRGMAAFCCGKNRAVFLAVKIEK